MRRILSALLLFAASAVSIRAQRPQDASWTDYGGTLAGQRFSTASLISRLNVTQLQPAWVFHTHALENASSINWRASFESTPVLWKDTLYFDSPFDAVFAVDASSGKLRWNFDPQVNREKPIYIATSRGVALWHAKKAQKGPCGADRVFVATLDRRLIARDASSGVPCSSFGNGGTVDLEQGVDIRDKRLYEFSSPPTVVGDVIVLGSTVGDSIDIFLASGAVRGFDVRTGRQLWSWEPMPQTAMQRPRVTGSGNAWSVIAADPEHDLIFVPTGSPSVDYYGGNRQGNNADADSIVALQASTGKKIWAFQLVHHDLWDYDTPAEPVLFTFRNSIPAVAVVGKTSMVYVFNRLNGAPLYPIVERPVPQSTLPGEHSSPTQPFSSLPSLTPLSFGPDDVHMANPADEKYCRTMLQSFDNRGLFTPPSAKGSVVYPGALGGANWGSAALDPASSVLYTRVSSMPYLVREIDAGPRGRSLWDRGVRFSKIVLPEWLGGYPPPLRKTFLTPDQGGEQRDESPQDGTPYLLARQAITTSTYIPCAPQPFGSVVAINLNTGAKLWSVPHGEMAPGYLGSVGAGGVIATAGGLVFAASTNDALLRAYDSATGKLLWRGALPAPANATPMTYVSHGRQYVVIAAGGHVALGTGQSDQVIAFALPEKSKSNKTH
jgi:quinoprotein glucose dehydrogenase